MICVIVTGIGTTGTSAIAGMLHRLGISMGSRLKGATTTNLKGYYEDLDYLEITYVRPLATRKIEMHKWAKKRMNEDNQIWGFKFSAFIGNSDITLNALKAIDPKLNIRIVRCTRDLEETARSKAVKVPRPSLILDDFRMKVRNNHRKNEEFFKKWHGPVLVVDFADTINNTKRVLDKLINFCFHESGMEPTEEQKSEALNFIDPNLKRF